MKILIAEDDFTSRTILAGVLKNHGHEVVETANGLDAWNTMLLPDAPKLVILDWMMPEMDGLEVCRRLRSLDTDVSPYIIILTAKGEKANIVAGLESGADDYLAKPFDPGELQARVNVGNRILELETKLLEARNALAREAMHDSLTGVLSRRAITDALSRELYIVRRYHNGLAVMICDIDHFKKINDTHGHMAGDEVLCGFARLLQGALRQYDILGRWGGEEFMVISPGIKENDLKTVCERLRTAIADNPIVTKVGNISLTVSIGAKIWKVNESSGEFLTAADSALYRAKSEGRNRVCIAADEQISEK